MNAASHFNWVAFKVARLDSVVLNGGSSVPHLGVTFVQAFTSQLFEPIYENAAISAEIEVSFLCMNVEIVLHNETVFVFVFLWLYRKLSK